MSAMALTDDLLHPRFSLANLRDALADTPVVAVNGARQVGKSTLVTELLDRPAGARAVTLDDATQREAARADPHAFVRRDGLLVIDEVQRVPEILPAIKAEVDRDRRPGRFLLTGSSRLLSVPEMSASLAGRVEILDLWPLSQGELTGRREGFVDAIFGWSPQLLADADLTRADYLERVCAGGFPEPLGRTGRRRQAWYANYTTTVVERMVAGVADIDRLAMMPRLLRACAARTGNELNIKAIADDLGLPVRTTSAYLAHLQTVFLVHQLPAWSRNLTSKVAHRPKLLIPDTGMAAHLLGVDARALSKPTSAAAGPLMETFVAMEIRKQLGWAATDAAMYHFRDRNGAEVDVVLEARDGRVAGVEVKAAGTVRASDFRGLRLLADRLGDQFAGGVVLYTGPEPVPFGDRLAAVPLAALWSGSSTSG
jgi:predicted AAA+ superfamily ATPase